MQGLWMKAHSVTVPEFTAFVAATGYVTAAERTSDQVLSSDSPGPTSRGSVGFRHASSPVQLDNAEAWWRFVPGASWRSPLGHPSTIGFDNKMAHAEDASTFHVGFGYVVRPASRLYQMLRLVSRPSADVVAEDRP